MNILCKMCKGIVVSFTFTIIFHLMVFKEFLLNFTVVILFLIISLLLTILFVSLQFVKKDLGKGREYAAKTFMLLGNFFIFLLLYNLITKLDQGFLTTVAVAGFFVLISDISYSLYRYNLNENPNGKLLTTLLLIVFTFGGMIFFVVNLIKSLMLIPVLVGQGYGLNDSEGLMANSIMFLSVGLSIIYIAHKIETDDGYVKGIMFWQPVKEKFRQLS